ncbi:MULTISPECIES: MarR family winged helix-turn-helix transcriptional regulator [Aestuariimicrobium]|uniref:MarR family winged helix-turn-helix transcriptional regulator n=1 Tax=Aestuariimicrobium TaxID=396388 RepID=UPI0003B35B24|nr:MULTISPECIES: MarR family transcriptional regulator [Aestuariimicrobium]
MEHPELSSRPAQVEAVMRAADVLLRVAARSVIEVEDRVTSPQLRVLVLIALHGPQNLGAVARELGVHASNATRTCDRLVAADLLSRRQEPTDRRYLKLDLTAQGRALVDSVLGHRRTAIADVIERIPSPEQESVARAMQVFADAGGGEGSEDGRFALGPAR